MHENNEIFDVLIVGGGPAGLTAALYLGRARRAVCVLDRGSPRHAVSQAVHNFLTRDGMSPQDLRRVAWEQMNEYPSVRHHTSTVSRLDRHGDLWHAQTEEGGRFSARALLLATGMIDEHPPIRGYAERWGTSIHHCPYCHGWESRDKVLAVLGSNDHAAMFSLLLRNWSEDVVLLTNGRELSAEDLGLLRASSLPVYTSHVDCLEGEGCALGRIHLRDGTVLKCEGLFVLGSQHQVPLVVSLGVPLNEEGYVIVDAFGATSHPMLWAAGDLTTPMQQVVEASAQGARVGGMINMSLVMADASLA